MLKARLVWLMGLVILVSGCANIPIIKDMYIVKDGADELEFMEWLTIRYIS